MKSPINMLPASPRYALAGGKLKRKNPIRAPAAIAWWRVGVLEQPGSAQKNER